MANRKKYRFRCPICGFVSWETRLKNRYRLELVEVNSNGRGLIENIFFDWDTDMPLHLLFERRFYEVLTYLLENRYIRANVVEKMAAAYATDEERTLFPRCIYNPRLIYHPRVIYHPKLIGGEKW